MSRSVIVIGGGSIGERHVRCFQRTGLAEVSLCELQDGVRRRVSEQYQLPASFRDLDEAIGARPEVAVVCTPAHLHVPMARQLAEAGVHLLIEKPLSTSVAGVEDLLAAVARSQLTAGVAYVYRSHPALADMKQALDGGEFGAAVQVVAVSGQHFPFYRPAYRDIYYKDRATGGGAIQDALTHVINAAEWLVGPVTDVAADAEQLVLEGVDVEDTVHVIARHQQVLGSYSLNQHQAPNEGFLTVVCQRGTARLELQRNRWLSCAEPGAEWTVRSQFDMQRDDLFVHQAAGFLQAVEQKSEPACPLLDGLQTLRTNLAILDSVQQRSWRAVDAPRTPAP